MYHRRQLLRRSFVFRDTILLVVGLPVSFLTIPATVHHEATPGAGRKFRRTGTPIKCGTIATNPAFGSGTLLVFLHLRIYIEAFSLHKCTLLGNAIEKLDGWIGACNRRKFPAKKLESVLKLVKAKFSFNSLLIHFCPA